MARLACLSVIAVPILLALMAAILRGAVESYNAAQRKRCLGNSAAPGDDDQLPRLNASTTIGIVVLRSIINLVVQVGLMSCAGMLWTPAKDRPVPWETGHLAVLQSLTSARLAIALFSTVVCFLLGAVVLQAFLPTTFGKACLVQIREYVVYLLIWLLIAGVLLMLPFGPQPIAPEGP